MAVFENKEALYDRLDRMTANLKQDDTFQDRIQRVDRAVGFVVPELDARYTLRLQEGNISGERDTLENTTIDVSMAPQNLDRLLRGRISGESAYMQGLLRLRGNEYTAQSMAYYMRYITNAYQQAAEEEA
jgi:hypothetical protein